MFCKASRKFVSLHGKFPPTWHCFIKSHKFRVWSLMWQGKRKQSYTQTSRTLGDPQSVNLGYINKTNPRTCIKSFSLMSLNFASLNFSWMFWIIKEYVCPFSAAVVKRRKAAVRRRWLFSENKALRLHFSRFFMDGRLPGKADITTVQKKVPELSSMHWKRIKDHVRQMQLKDFHWNPFECRIKCHIVSDSFMVIFLCK